MRAVGELALLLPFAVIAAALVGVSLAITLRLYQRLPAEVPEHFDGYGRPDVMGPRPMIFAVIAAQFIVVAIWAGVVYSVFSDADAPRRIVAFGIAAIGVLGALTWMHFGVLAVAHGKAERINHPFRPLVLIAVAIAIAIGLSLPTR